MDENAFVPGSPTNPAQPIAGPIANPVPPAQPVVPPQAIGQPVTAQQPTVQQPPSPAPETSPRITLQDLYGPSQPGELQTTPPVEQQPIQPSVVAQPSVPDQTTVSEQPEAQAPLQPEMQPQASSVQPIEQPVAEVQPGESQRRIVPEPTDVSPTEQSMPSVHGAQLPSASESVAPESEDMGNGGFHFSSILRFVIGGFILLILVLIIFSIGSLLFSGKKGSGNVTLTYWGLWESSNVMQPILDEFHKEHPSITVNYVKEDPKDYTKRLLTRMQEGDGPDIFTIHNTWVYPLQNVLLPIPTSVIDTKTLSSNYPSVVTDDMLSNGAVYGLPIGMDALSLFVNTDIFTHAGANVPTTWDNFITVAKALTVKDPDGHIQTSGASIGTYDNVAHAPDIISLLLLQNGADVKKLQGSTNATDALSFYTSFASGNGSVWDSTLDNSLRAFERGKVAMYFGYSYDIFAIQVANPQLKFAIYPVPHLPGRDMTIASYWVNSISSRSQHQKEAVEFMQYLAQKNTQANLYTQEATTRSFGELYARLDLAQGVASNPLLAPFVNQFKSAKSSFFVADTNYDEYNGALNQYLGNAINSMLSDTSTDTATATLAQGVAQVLSTYAPKTQ